MPQTPNIPNSSGAFGLGGGNNDPSFQWDMPGIQEGAAGIYPTAPGQTALPGWKSTFTPGGPLRILFCGDSIVCGFTFGGATTPASHLIQRMMRSLHGLGDGGIGLMLPFWAGLAGSGVTANGTPVVNTITGMGIGSTARVIDLVNNYTFNTANVTFNAGGTAVCQSMDVMYIDVGAIGADVQYKIDGGATQTLVTAKTGDYRVKTVRIPSGAAPAGLTNAAHSVQILGNGGFGLSLVGVIAYAGTNGPSGVQVYNAGVGGVTTYDYASGNTSNAAFGTDFINIIQPHLTVILIGINDTLSSVTRTLERFQAAYTTLGFTAKFYGDAIFIAPPQLYPNWSAGFPLYFNQDQLETAIATSAQGYTSPMLSLRACWGNYGEANANGMIGDALVHPSQNGQRDIANRVYQIMMRS